MNGHLVIGDADEATIAPGETTVRLDVTPIDLAITRINDVGVERLPVPHGHAGGQLLIVAGAADLADDRHGQDGRRRSRRAGGQAVSCDDGEQGGDANVVFHVFLVCSVWL